MALLTIDYCMTCHDQTEHGDGNCSPCYVKECARVELEEDERWAGFTLTQKVDFLYELTKRRPRP